MTNTPEERKIAHSISRGIPILFIILGGFASCSRNAPGAPPADFIAGLFAFAFAGALFLKLSWARWLALGACYLAIIGACTLPALLFLRDPLREFVDPASSTAATNAMLSVFGFAFGGLGYKGLKYYRSDLGRVEHSPRSIRPQDVAPERSTAVLYSAIVWAVLLTIGGLAGMSAPRWLAGAASHRAQPPAAAASKLTFLEVPHHGSDGPAPADSDTAAPPAAPDRPDLIPLALCIEGVDVALAYINAGIPTRDTFRLYATENGYERSSRRHREYRVPDPNKLEFASFAQESSVAMAPGTRANVTVSLDVENKIAESDESDNTKTFTVTRGRDRKLDVGRCDQLVLIH